MNDARRQENNTEDLRKLTNKETKNPTKVYLYVLNWINFINYASEYINGNSILHIHSVWYSSLSSGFIICKLRAFKWVRHLFSQKAKTIATVNFKTVFEWCALMRSQYIFHEQTTQAAISKTFPSLMSIIKMTSWKMFLQTGKRPSVSVWQRNGTVMIATKTIGCWHLQFNRKYLYVYRIP